LLENREITFRNGALLNRPFPFPVAPGLYETLCPRLLEIVVAGV
jgi:hypothetical protein